MGGTWSHDGELIIFSALVGGIGALFQVSATGGTPERLALPQKSETLVGQSLLSPYFLPAGAGSRVLVYAAGEALVLHDLAADRLELLRAGAFPTYSPSGHLVFQVSRDDYILQAVAFSLQSLQLAGQPFTLRESAGYPSVAQDGTLVYLEPAETRIRQLALWDRHGARVGTIGQSQRGLAMPELSPDGRQVLVTSVETGNHDIWVHDMTAASGKQRLTFDSSDERMSIWLPRGEQISFSSVRPGEKGTAIYVLSADGTGTAQLLLASPTGVFLGDWSVDGKYMIFSQGAGGGADLYYLGRNEDGGEHDAVPFVTTPFETVYPKFSPDGKYVTYESNETGRYQVYVQTFPQGGGKRQISVNGGTQARWRRDGKELFYVQGNTLVAVPVTTVGGFSAGEPERLFEPGPGMLEGRGYRYTVTADGQRFIIVEDAGGDQAKVPAIQVTQNWFAEFQNRQQD